jgi:formylglycine-generating enzyme required for sulfatase activity
MNLRLATVRAFHDGAMQRTVSILLLVIGSVSHLSAATTPPAARWTNSLGMVFVSLPDTAVAFSIWETRLQDYAVFVNEGHWGQLWPRKPEFAQETNHPVVNVSWEDAKGFCTWLTKRERDLGMLTTNQAYRLPTDREWSAAVGLARESGRTPETRRSAVFNHYPWGQPKIQPADKPSGRPRAIIPAGVANYLGAEDGYRWTAPVGSFAPNRLGIYDLGGNVWEWCIDFADDGRRNILRGGSWYGGAITSDGRDFTLPDGEAGDVGFRCVRADGPVWLD